MTATAHALVGTVIAAKIGNPALAIPLALGSHIIMDMIPHWDPLTTRKEKGINRTAMDVWADGTAAAITSYLLIFFLFPHTSLIYAGVIIFFSLLEDFLAGPYLLLGWNFFPFYQFYRFTKLTDNLLNSGKKLNNIWGKIDQAVIVVCVIVLAKFI